MRPEVTYRVEACTRYAVEENHRVQLFVELARGRRRRPVVRRSAVDGRDHVSIALRLHRDRARLRQDRSARRAGARRRSRDGIFGAKITGGGGGGTVAILGRRDAEDALSRIIERYRQATGIDAYVFRGSSPGADRFGVVVLEP